MMYHKVIKIELETSTHGRMFLNLWHKKPWRREASLRSAINWGLLEFEFFTLEGKFP